MIRLVLGKVKSQGITSQLTAEAGVIKTFSHEEGKACRKQKSFMKQEDRTYGDP